MAVKSIKAKPFVEILWLDAEDFSEAGWAGEEAIKSFGSTPCLVTSYGWLIHKTKTYVTIAADLIPPSTYGRMMKIPVKMITSTREVSVIAPTLATTETPTDKT